MKSMKPHLQQERLTAALRTSALHAINRRFEREARHEVYLVAILVTGNESTGFTVLTADLSAWDAAEVNSVRQFADGLLADRRENSDFDASRIFQEIADGGTDMDEPFLLGVSLVDGLQSKNITLADRVTGRSRIEGYRTVVVFADQSAALAVTQPEDSYQILVSNAHINQPYLESNLYDAPSDPRDDSTFARSESMPFLDLLNLFTVMTADLDDLAPL